MSRKRRAPKRKYYPDPKYKSMTVSKFINAIMYDGKRSSAEKILYTAMDKMKNKTETQYQQYYQTLYLFLLIVM